MKYIKFILKIIAEFMVFAINLFGIAVCFAVPYLYDIFETVDLDALLYNVIMPTDGIDTGYIKDILLKIIGPTTLCFLIVIVFFVFLGKKTKERKKIFITAVSVETVAIFAVSSALLFSFFRSGEFISSHMQSSELIEQNYVDPRNVQMEFPEKKRNLIYIYLEAMETTYMDKDSGGKFEENCIPELTELCREYTNFSPDDGIGGFRMIKGADYTTASIFAQTTGLPIKMLPGLGQDYIQNNFMPGVYGLGEILQKNGYKNYFIIGSKKAIGGRAGYLGHHGNYEIFDYNTAIDRGYIDKDYKVWWGYEDKKLFEYAKIELKKLASKKQPFNFNMLTVDTHYVDGYVCGLCENKYDSQYANVFACSSKQVYNFVRWIQEQDFYENTTIIICGDHLSMNNSFVSGDEENRYVYNVCINSVVESGNTKNRQFCATDMFPTTLAALGVKIPGERLGLGTNLFSGKETLMEEMGWKKFMYEIKKDSEYYNTHFLK